MTRRESLAAIGLLYLLLAVGVTWQFGPIGLIACAVLGIAAVLFLFERVEDRRGEGVPDPVPDPLAAFERDLSRL